MQAFDDYFYVLNEVKFSEILEIWECQCNIGRTDSKQPVTELESLKDLLLYLKREGSEIKGNTYHTVIHKKRIDRGDLQNKPNSK